MIEVQSADCGLPAGTPVLTPNGRLPVESLTPGMLVLAVSGGAAPFQPVVALRHIPHAGGMIRVRAWALDDLTPQEDLLLPPGHALLIDGVLVPVGSLVDGFGILAEPETTPIVLYAPVLARHDAILAAGLAVESALPAPDAPFCAPREAAGGALCAALAWRAETLGWAPATESATSAVDLGLSMPVSLRDRLASHPLTPASPGPLPTTDSG